MLTITKIAKNIPGAACSALGILFITLGIVIALWAGTLTGADSFIMSGIGLTIGGFFIAPYNYNRITKILTDMDQATGWMSLKEFFGVGILFIVIGFVCLFV